VPRKGKKEACILGVGRAVPPQEVPTQQYLDFCIKSLQLDSQPKVVEALQKVRASCAALCVSCRVMCVVCRVVRVVSCRVG
jgi:uncharacterized protein (DUF2236 family)